MKPESFEFEAGDGKDRVITDPDERALLDLELALGEIDEVAERQGDPVELQALGQLLIEKIGVAREIVRENNLAKKERLRKELAELDGQSAQAMPEIHKFVTPEIAKLLDEDIARRVHWRGEKQ